jgi:hypothetical protein
MTVLNHLCGIVTKVNVKLSLYRPGQAPGLQEVEISRIFRQSIHEGSNVVNPKHRPALHPQEISLVLISVRD